MGLGAVLYQTQEDGTKAVIAYASRSLSKLSESQVESQVGVSCSEVGIGQEIPWILVWVNL